MLSPRTAVRRLAASLALPLIAAPALATSIYQYKPSEYAIVDGGMAPNRALSVAAHGGGESGYDNFHLYLMTEPAHRKAAALPFISGDKILDTGADAYHAAWSPDSRHLAVLFRLSHQVATFALYEIRNRRPIMLDAPSLFSQVATPLTEADRSLALKRASTELSWLTPTRFVMKEHQLFQVGSHVLAQKLGAFGKESADAAATPSSGGSEPSGRMVNSYLVAFSAEAVCDLARGRGYKIVSVKPGAFD